MNSGTLNLKCQGNIPFHEEKEFMSLTPITIGIGHDNDDSILIDASISMWLRFFVKYERQLGYFTMSTLTYVIANNKATNVPATSVLLSNQLL